MEMKWSLLKSGERAMLSLRELYSRFGYTQFKMSRFEEYDFYARSRNFLRGDRIVTFTDTHGRLMALRPDVTLSIVKNVQNGGDPVKVYYSENVYRAPSEGEEIGEIMQTGLECIGDIDLYQTSEVLTLAVRSLATVGERYLLDISHTGLLSAFLSEVSDTEGREALLCAIREKNVPGAVSVCREVGVSEATVARISAAAALYAPLPEATARLRSLGLEGEAAEALREIEALYGILEQNGVAENIRFDFSIVPDLDYYNGILMRGYLEGLPQCVLSGGRYDKLLAKMGKRGGAIGFAVYLDQLERYRETAREYDVDILLLYDSATDAASLSRAVAMLGEGGKSVRVEKQIPAGIRCRQMLQMKDRGIEILDGNA